MRKHAFTDAQAHHANKVVIELMKKRRFFIDKEKGPAYEKNPGSSLDPVIFEGAWKLQADLISKYKAATQKAVRMITAAEQRLGFTPAELEDRQLVQCNRYTGGLDICRVYPLTLFLKRAPASLEELQQQELQRLMGSGKTADDYSAKELQGLRDISQENTRRIWDELATLKGRSEASCVVLLKTRFFPSEGFASGDFLEGRLSDIELLPHATGYLFYEYSKRVRIVRHAFVVFNTSRKSHVRMEHWRDKEPSLSFSEPRGYDCQVYIPLIL